MRNSQSLSCPMVSPWCRQRQAVKTPNFRILLPQDKQLKARADNTSNMRASWRGLRVEEAYRMPPNQHPFHIVKSYGGITVSNGHCRPRTKDHLTTL
jgi:hypothetical protein